MKNLWKWLRGGREPFAAAKDARIGLPELERAVASVEPAARLVPPRLLRRVVRLHTSLPGMGFRVPHGKSYVIARDALWEIADRSEIGFSPAEDLPEDVILLERPSGEILQQRPRGEILLYCWELLFHARVHEAFRRLAQQQRFGPAEFQERLAALGRLEFDEIRSVLRQERFLLPPYDDPSTYVEFAAVYLGIRYFQPYLMASFFPALRSLEKVDEVIARDIDAGKLLEASRLPGTPRPEELREAARIAAEAFDLDPLGAILDHEDSQSPRGARWAHGRRRSEQEYRAWSQRAARQAARGNLAGAAVRRARAEFRAPRARAAEAATALRDAVHGLVDRLQSALGLEDEEPRPGARPCWPWPIRRRGDCGPSRPGCCTICKRPASTRSGRLPRSTSCSGSCRWGGGRSAANCPTSAWCSCRGTSARPAAAAFRADFGTAAAAARGSPGRGDQEGRDSTPRGLSPQDRRRAR